MEGLSPQLHLLLYVKTNIELHQSIRKALVTWIDENPHPPILGDDKISIQTIERQIAKDPRVGLFVSVRDLVAKSNGERSYKQQFQPTTRALIELLRRGLQGEPIYQQLCDLESQLVEEALGQIQGFSQRLPFLLMIPLFLFLFPALVLLMLTPLLMQILHI